MPRPHLDQLSQPHWGRSPGVSCNNAVAKGSQSVGQRSGAPGPSLQPASGQRGMSAQLWYAGLSFQF